jgi:hypothetical protein
MKLELIKIRYEIKRIDDLILIKFLDRYKQGKSKCEFNSNRVYHLYINLIGGYGLIENNNKSTLELDNEIMHFIDLRTYIFPKFVAEIKY